MRGPALAMACALAFLSPGCFGLGSLGDRHVSANTPSEAYLWTNPYPHLAVEIDHIEGVRPSAFAVDALTSALRNVTHKQSVSVLPFGTFPRQSPSVAEEKEWTSEELAALATQLLTNAEPGRYGKGDTANLHIVYVDGSSGEEPSAVALAVGATIFVFKGAAPSVIKLPRSGPSASDLSERSILIHEAGHVLGLVDRGLPMVRNHADPESPHHSSNPKSVMSAGIDALRMRTGDIIPENAPPWNFDKDDLADIAAFQAREPGTSRR